MLGGRSVTDTSRAASSEPRGASSDLDTEATHKIEKSGSAAGGVNGLGDRVDSADLEAMKQEILREMRKEINKAKLEIIDAIKLELSRR